MTSLLATTQTLPFPSNFFLKKTPFLLKNHGLHIYCDLVLVLFLMNGRPCSHTNMLGHIFARVSHVVKNDTFDTAGSQIPSIFTSPQGTTVCSALQKYMEAYRHFLHNSIRRLMLESLLSLMFLRPGILLFILKVDTNSGNVAK